jgi:hypothetical protein
MACFGGECKRFPQTDCLITLLLLAIEQLYHHGFLIEQCRLDAQAKRQRLGQTT